MTADAKYLLIYKTFEIIEPILKDFEEGLGISPEDYLVYEGNDEVCVFITEDANLIETIKAIVPDNILKEPSSQEINILRDKESSLSKSRGNKNLLSNVRS